MKLNNMKILSDTDMDLIHKSSQEVLANTGIMINSRKVLELLERNGADVDHAGKIAKISPKLLEKALNTVPKTFKLYNRDQNGFITIGDGTPKCGSGHNAIYLITPESNQRQNAKVRDVEDFAIVSDYLEDIDIVGVPLMPQDISIPAASLLYAVKALYENTTKPIFFSTDSHSINTALIGMMKSVSGSPDVSECPTAISQLSPTSPLFWEEGAAEALIYTSREGIPLNLLPEPMAGLSAPYSVAGLLTIHNIEVLSGMVISQLAKPGAPVIYGSSWTTYDMKYIAAIIGSPETDILRIAGGQMAKYYGMPSHTTAPNSDSNLHDEQNAWEKSISNLCALCSGNDIVMNSGMFATGLTISHEQLVIDDEVNGIIRRIARGIDVSTRTIDVDSIRNIGHRGDYLMEDLTLENLRSDEFREPKISNLKAFDNWTREGSPSVVQNANRKVGEYLSKGTRHPLSPEKSSALDGIIRQFIENH